MRSYPRNSPEAAARIVALAMLADGHVCRTEAERIDHLRAHEQLGLDQAGWHAVTHACCEDLLATAETPWATACRVDARTLGDLMGEVDDPALRRTVLGLCVSVAEADDHLSDGESALLVAAVEHWGMKRELMQGAS